MLPGRTGAGIDRRQVPVRSAYIPEWHAHTARGVLTPRPPATDCLLSLDRRLHEVARRSRHCHCSSVQEPSR